MHRSRVDVALARACHILNLCAAYVAARRQAKSQYTSTKLFCGAQLTKSGSVLLLHFMWRQSISLHAAWRNALRLRFAMHCARILFPVQLAANDVDVNADNDVLVSMSL